MGLCKMNCLNQLTISCRQIAKRYCTSTSDDVIVIKKLSNVMTIGINRPKTRNALNYETANKLSDAITLLEEDDSVLAGVIHGIGGNFCSGFDLKEMNSEPDITDKLAGLRLTDRFVSKPVIAAVSGYALGIGMDLAMWCDIRIMEETAILGYFERRFGIPQSPGALFRLKHMAGLSRSLDWVLTGRPIRAQEAHSSGVVSQIVACGTALGQSYSLATCISKFPQSALNTDRAALYLACLSEKHIQAGFVSAYQQINFSKSIEEARQGMKKFAEGHGRHGKAVPNLIDEKVNEKKEP